jgi:hypothetical protein
LHGNHLQAANFALTVQQYHLQHPGRLDASCSFIFELQLSCKARSRSTQPPQPLKSPAPSQYALLQS